jgi:hypothetical protein
MFAMNSPSAADRLILKGNGQARCQEQEWSLIVRDVWAVSLHFDAPAGRSQAIKRHHVPPREVLRSARN